MIMRHCLGLEGARGGRLLLLLHQPHVGHQVPPPSSCWTIFIHNNHFQSRDFFIKTLDDSASGIQAIMARLADRLIWTGHRYFVKSLLHTPTHQVEGGGPGLCRHSQRTGLLTEHLTPDWRFPPLLSTISSNTWLKFLSVAGNQDAVFCFSLALPSPLPGCTKVIKE